MIQAHTLRNRLEAPDIVVAPGVYDGATARLVANAGFSAAYMTGAGVSATYGLPDYGLLTLREMVDRGGLIAQAVDIPIVADADTGYGNELNVTRAVREYESHGVAAIHIEDQVSPKRCGHLAGKEVVERDEFLAKIRAAVAARRDPNFIVIARTDARAVHGLEEAIARANDALAEGADMIFLEATQTVDEAAAVPTRVNGPCMLNMVLGGMTPIYDVGQAQDMGYCMTIMPAVLLTPMVETLKHTLTELRASGRHPGVEHAMKIDEVFQQFGAREWDALRTAFHPRCRDQSR